MRTWERGRPARKSKDSSEPPPWERGRPARKSKEFERAPPWERGRPARKHKEFDRASPPRSQVDRRREGTAPSPLDSGKDATPCADDLLG